MNTCEECGASTELDGSFCKVKIGTQKKRLLCPTCAEYLRHERGRKVYKELIFGLLFGLLFMFINTDAPWLFLNIYLVFAMMYVSIVPHELGHALAVWVMRQKLLFIRFGRGHSWIVKKVRGVYLDFQSQPVGGFVGHTYRKSGTMRLTQAIIYACGPLANIGIFLLVITVFADSVMHESFGKTFSPWRALFISNLILGVSNLVPYKLQTRHGPVPNDGMGILVSLFGKRKTEKSEIMRDLQCAFVAFEYQDYRACQIYAKRALERDSTDVLSRNMLAISLEGIGEIDNAIDILVETLALPNVDEKVKPVLQSNLSYFYLVKGEPENYQKALDLSGSAMANFPWELTVRSNYGGIQIVAGDIDEGIRVLRDKRFIISRPDVRADIHALLAIGYAKKGQREQADKELQIAHKLDPRCKYLARATAAVTEDNRKPVL